MITESSHVQDQDNNWNERSEQGHDQEEDKRLECYHCKQFLMKEYNWSMISERSHDQDQDNYWNENIECHDQDEYDDCDVSNVR